MDRKMIMTVVVAVALSYVLFGRKNGGLSVMGGVGVGSGSANAGANSNANAMAQ
tara:strand:+ start:332 stop:493 length:162 start_codon:yes stop_codon:yes gene_type:complete